MNGLVNQVARTDASCQRNIQIADVSGNKPDVYRMIAFEFPQQLTGGQSIPAPACRDPATQGRVMLVGQSHGIGAGVRDSQFKVSHQWTQHPLQRLDHVHVIIRNENHDGAFHVPIPWKWADPDQWRMMRHVRRVFSPLQIVRPEKSG